MNYFGFSSEEPDYCGFLIYDENGSIWKVLFNDNQSIRVICSPDDILYHSERQDENHIVLKCFDRTQKYRYLSITPIDKNKILFTETEAKDLHCRQVKCDCKTIRLLDYDNLEDLRKDADDAYESFHRYDDDDIDKYRAEQLKSAYEFFNKNT